MDDEQKTEDTTRNTHPVSSDGSDQTMRDARCEMRDARCEKCDEYLAGWKRAQADYDNLKKEMDRERQDFAKYANSRLLEDLLPALDQFRLVIAHLPSTATLPETERKTWENWLIGVRAVQSLWEQAAKSQGLERIATDGPFDPTLHEASGEETADGKEAGSILRTVEDGWKLYGRVLRPAKVILVK